MPLVISDFRLASDLNLASKTDPSDGLNRDSCRHQGNVCKGEFVIFFRREEKECLIGRVLEILG